MEILWAIGFILLVQCNIFVFSTVLFYGIGEFPDDVIIWVLTSSIASILWCFVWFPIYIVNVWIRDIEETQFHTFD